MGKAVDSPLMGSRSRLGSFHVLRAAGIVVAISSWGPPNLAAPLPMPQSPAPTAFVPSDPLARGVMSMSMTLLPPATEPHQWRLIEGKHWQIVAPPGED